MSNGSNKSLEVTAMKPSDVVAVLSSAYRRKITEEQVLEVAEMGNLLSADGTINLIHYTAFLAGEVSVGSN
jgi:hypothetical protein